MRHISSQQKYPFCTLLVLDGWGEATFTPSNAIKIAKTPHLDYLYSHSFHTLLQASGEAVGLPKGVIGNSEVGHLNIGSGKVVLQEIFEINQEIIDGSFFKNKAFLDGITHAINNKKAIHLLGLVSDSLVHSSIKHLIALLKLCADRGIKENVFIHVITDGRDTAPDAAFEFICAIENAVRIYHVGEIASVSGRYYAMDRDERWERTQKAYNAIVAEENDTRIFLNVHDGIASSYAQNVLDEFIIPFRIHLKSNDTMHGLVKEEDTVIFFNFREDRTRQLTKAFVINDFNELNGFNRSKFLNPYFITMTEYEKDLCDHIAYEKDINEEPISKVIADHGYQQIKIAETEKYAHVTYFFNGGREVPFPMEDRILIPSLKIPTYDLMPQMRVKEIAASLIEKIEEKKYKLLVANFANADMVGHTGNLKATIKACEFIDEQIGKIFSSVFENDGLLVITADHGNAEMKLNSITGQISTMHTTNPVPFIYSSKSMRQHPSSAFGKLADIAPTILASLGLDRSYPMDGNNLVI